MDDKKHLSSLRRGLEALSILNIQDSLTGSELAARLKIPRTTAHRILDTLAADGYVVHDIANRCFRLSTKVRHIAFGFNRDSLLAEVARPVLQALCRETLMPVGLTTPVGQHIVTQVSTDHEAPLALERIEEGSTFPLTLGASGHIYLAHCAKDVREKLLSAAARAAPGDSPQTRPSDADLDRIRSDQYAISPPRDGWAEGIIAVPVYFNG
jgi:DNA-binding IclR family transcriptional regulator